MEMDTDRNCEGNFIDHLTHESCKVIQIKYCEVQFPKLFLQYLSSNFAMFEQKFFFFFEKLSKIFQARMNSRVWY